jgi:hypothetical protein
MKLPAAFFLGLSNHLQDKLSFHPYFMARTQLRLSKRVFEPGETAMPQRWLIAREARDTQAKR